MTLAVVYGRQGGGLQKKKFRLIDLWECKVSDETDSIPAVINTVAGTANSQKYGYWWLQTCVALHTDAGVRVSVSL